MISKSTMPANHRDWIKQGEVIGSRTDLSAVLMTAYGEAECNAIKSSQRSLLQSHLDIQLERKALWDEAVAQTIERILSLLVEGNERWEELHLPDPWQ